MSGVFLSAPGPVFQDPNQQAVQSNATLTASGSSVFTGYGTSEISLFVNVTANPTGTTPTLQYTIQEVDPGDGTTVIGSTASTTVISATGIQKITLVSAYGGSVKVSWTITGTTPSFTGVYASLVGKSASTLLVDTSGAATGSASNPLRTDPTGTTTQPVSAVSLPLPAGAATAANQTTLGAQTTEINDGTRTATIKAASTAAGATDTALVVAVSPNNTVPVSAASLPLPTGAATSANQTTVGSQTTKINDGTTTVAVKAASTAAGATDPALVVAISPNNTVPVSVASLPLPTGAATSANQTTIGSQTTKLNDGITTVAVKAASTAAVATDTALVVAVSPNNTVPVSAASLPLPAGASTAANQTTVGNQTTKINDGTTTAAVKAASTAAGATDPALVVAISPNNTIPVSAASLPLPSGASTSANQTNGTQKSQTVDGSGNIQPSGDTVGRAIFEKITDGTSTAAVKAASTAAVATDQALVVAVSPNNTIPVSAASLPLPSGAATAANQTTIGNQTTKLNDGTHTAAITAASALKVDGSAVTQPVNGTVTVGGVSGTVTIAGTVEQGTPPWEFDLENVGGSAVLVLDAGEQKVAVEGFNATGEAPTARPVLIGVTEGSRVYPALSNSDGCLRIDPIGVTTQPVSFASTLSVVTQETTTTGVLNALNANATIKTTGHTGAGFTIQAGTLIGTVVPEWSEDGNHWIGGIFWDAINNSYGTGVGFPSSPNALTILQIMPFAGATYVRIRVSAYTSGTANADLCASQLNTGATAVIQAPGPKAPQQPWSVQLTDGSHTTPMMDAVTRGAFVIPSDGTNACTVKAATQASVSGDKSLVVAMSPNTVGYVTSISPQAAIAGLVMGKVALSTLTINTKQAVRRTAYTEQTSGAQRSVSSSSANDTSAGTGARTVKITYVTSDGSTRNTETVTMNGTTAVATANSDICFIEKMEVITVGSTGANVGTISLFVNNSGGGGTIGTITTDNSGTVVGVNNRTYWGHHYVLSHKTCYITSFNGSSKGAIGAEMWLSAVDPTSSASPDTQVSDSLFLGPSVSSVVRRVPNTIPVLGPARITIYVDPTADSGSFVGGFEYYDQ